MTDHDLLESYRTEKSEPAFTTLVQRHIDLVYSAALRQVGSSEAAKEVCHAVFIDLAAHAGLLDRRVHLATWLLGATRRRCLEFRRNGRTGEPERTRRIIDSTETPHQAMWRQIAPHLDEAIHALPARDRQALVRQFWEYESRPELAAALRRSEDTAQTVVQHALDQLRFALAREGAGIGSAGLAAVLAAFAVEPAPFGLGILVGRAAANSVHAARSAAVRELAVSLGRKSLIAAAVGLVALFIGLTWRRHLLADELTRLEARRSELEVQLHAHGRQSAHSVDRHHGSLAIGASGAAVPEGRAHVLARRIQRIHDYLSRIPDDVSPQMSLLTNADWVVIADKYDGLDNYASDPAAQAEQVAVINQAVTELDQRASQRFRPLLADALRSFRRETGRPVPGAIRDLLPYFSAPVDASFLNGYALVAARDASVANIPSVQYVQYTRFGATWTLPLEP